MDLDSPPTTCNKKTSLLRRLQAQTIPNATSPMGKIHIGGWVDGVKVQYQHYRKPMANSLVMMKCSAMPDKIKRTALTQEGIRILRNTSLELRQGVAAEHTTNSVLA